MKTLLGGLALSATRKVPNLVALNFRLNSVDIFFPRRSPLLRQTNQVRTARSG